MIGKIIKSFIFALRGLKATWKEEQNFKIEVFIGLGVILSIFYFDFTFEEKIFSILAIIIVLAAEIINTAIEDLCNKVEPMTDPVIAKIKDTSSAFVLVSSLGALIVGILVFLNHFI